MKTYFEINKKENCYGCKACEQACPKKCISMKSDREGFWYPGIDKNKCINCNLCIKVCPYNMDSYKITTLNQPKAFAAINKNEDIRKSSTSGGIFSSITDYILKNNGVVFGVELDTKGEVKHSFSDSRDEIFKYRGSKYVQSDINKSYKHAKEMLDNGRSILFTGTPCQIAGLYSYLRKDYDNLYTCDIVCHGVPSPRVFKDYYAFMKKSIKVILQV